MYFKILIGILTIFFVFDLTLCMKRCAKQLLNDKACLDFFTKAFSYLGHLHSQSFYKSGSEWLYNCLPNSMKTTSAKQTLLDCSNFAEIHVFVIGGLNLHEWRWVSLPWSHESESGYCVHQNLLAQIEADPSRGKWEGDWSVDFKLRLTIFGLFIFFSRRIQAHLESSQIWWVSVKNFRNFCKVRERKERGRCHSSIFPYMIESECLIWHNFKQWCV